MARILRCRDVVAPFTLLLALTCVYWVDSRSAPRAGFQPGGPRTGQQDATSLLAQRVEPSATTDTVAKLESSPASTPCDAPQAEKAEPARKPVLEEPQPAESVRIAAAETKAERERARASRGAARQIKISTPYQELKAIETAKRDKHGNLEGTQFDLARDGAFEGLQIAVIHLYGFDFQQARAALAEKGFGGRLSGDLHGDQVARGKTNGSRSGMVREHLICTELENLYEGITISTIETHAELQPIVYGSAGNVVVAAYDRDGKRALLDGGFTRLFHKWDTAATGRYVKNAAAWLVNYEGAGRAWFDPRYVEAREILQALEKAPETDIVKALSRANPLERWPALVTSQKKALRRPDEFVMLLKDDHESVRQEALKTLRAMPANDDDNPRLEAGAKSWDAVRERWGSRRSAYSRSVGFPPFSASRQRWP